MAKIVVRHVKPMDAEQLHLLWQNSNVQSQTLQLPHSPLSLWEGRAADISSDHISLVAEIDHRIVGQLGIGMNKAMRRRHVADLGMGVDDAWQGQGVGSALLEEAISLVENWMGATRIELTVYTDNESAIGLYKKFGFIIEGESANYAMRDGELVSAYHMARLKST